MATNKQAVIRYEALDRRLSNTGRKFFIDDLIRYVSEALTDYTGKGFSVSRRQILKGMDFMRSEGMKKLTVIFLMFLAIHIVSAQEDPISEFYGVKFGSTKAQVMSKMTNKGFKPKSNNPSYLIYEKVKFLNKEVSMIFKFVDDELFEGVVLFTPDLESQLIRMYRSISDDVRMKYGKGRDYETYDYPYEKGDGHELTAIRLGKAQFTTYWGIQSVEGTEGKEPNTISLEIDPKGYIALTYQDSERIAKAIAQQNSKKIDDL